MSIQPACCNLSVQEFNTIDEVCDDCDTRAKDYYEDLAVDQAWEIFNEGRYDNGS